MDDYACAEGDAVIEIDNIGIAHTHTAMARRRADEGLLIRPMDINISLAGICIVRFHTPQPQDTAEDGIFISSFHCDFSGRLSGLEDRPWRGAIAKFFLDHEMADGSFVASGLGPEAEFRSRDRVAGDYALALEQVEPLLAHAYMDGNWRLALAGQCA